MKQFQFTVQGREDFRREIIKIRQWCGARVTSAVLFQIYTEVLDREHLYEVCHTIEEEMPEALYVGCSSNGNIIKGDFSGGSIAVICTVFEYPSTSIKILQYTLNNDTQEQVVKSVTDILDACPWVKAVEMLLTIRGMSMTGFCDALSEARGDVQIFGGGAFSVDINEDSACVYSKEGGYQEQGIVFVLMGGEDFYVETTYATGWKALGMQLEVTSSEGAVVKELNHTPAYDTYFRYLNIRNDENFFNNTLEFPFLFQHHGIELLRAPISSNPDGSLNMTADIEENVLARIAYGDPWTILNSIREEARGLRAFAPEVINVFSCAARRTFWGNDEIGKETRPLQAIAPTSGFYTSSEFVRTGKYVNQHNVTLVIAAMREGDPQELPEADPEEEEQFEGKVSMINRLATFIKATTEELIEANNRLELMAVTDGLTGLFNRKEIQRRITEACAQNNVSPSSLVMMDIDDFKHVNDTYGHEAGDRVLIGLGEFLLRICKEEHIWAGRWGGEEFMVLVPGGTRERSMEIAERIRTGFAALFFEEVGHKTISVGVTEGAAGESSDATCSRVDSALYRAKASGKNCTVYFPAGGASDIMEPER